MTSTIEITKIENREEKELIAAAISNVLDSKVRFSAEWDEYIKFVEAWTKVNGPLYAVYSE